MGAHRTLMRVTLMRAVAPSEDAPKKGWLLLMITQEDAKLMFSTIRSWRTFCIACKDVAREWWEWGRSSTFSSYKGGCGKRNYFWWISSIVEVIGKIIWRRWSGLFSCWIGRGAFFMRCGGITWMKKDHLLPLLQGTMKITAPECQGHKLWLHSYSILQDKGAIYATA